MSKNKKKSSTQDITQQAKKVEQEVVNTLQKTLSDFMVFLREQGVIGLSVAVILGAAVTKLVGSLVSDIINPIIGILLGAAGDLSSFSIKIGSANVMWGSFVASLIDFIIIATVVYFGLKFLKLDKLDKKPE